MTNRVDVDVQGPRTFRLDCAILLYVTREPLGGDGEVFPMIHTVEQRKGGTVLGPGRPATTEGCAAFAAAIADRAAFAGFLDPQLLYVGPHIAAWWRAPAPACVWFNTNKEPAGDQTKVTIGKRSGVTPHPGTVFVLAHGCWYVYAVKGAERPGAETPLFLAPYFNVWSSGQICEGNVKRPDRVNAETMRAFERAFFDSRFTHPNVTKLVQWSGGAGALWTALLDGKLKTFPERCLLPMKATLAAQLRKLEKGKGRD